MSLVRKISKKRRFFSENRAPGIWGIWLPSNTLIDFANTAVVSKSFLEPKWMIAEVYRAHSGVTGPMNFKKSGRFLSGKSGSRGFGAPGCHPRTLIELVNSALGSRESVETICTFWEGCRTHRGVSGPMNFKKLGFFLGNSCSRKFGAPGCHPSTSIDFINTALANIGSVKTKCLIAEVYRTHSVVTGPINFEKNQDVF